jgi:D-hydroxyproline dehydrogenase
VFFPDTRHSVDPLQLTRRLAEKFVEEGGAIVQQEVRNIALKGDRPSVISSQGNTQFDKVVLAAGAWSRVLARSAGVRVPLDTERGYHAMLPSPRVQLQVPVISGDHNIAITPMTHGIRVSGTVEFAGLRALPDYARAEKLIGLAQQVLPGLQCEDATFWMGFRPSMPDSLPVIGFGPKSRNILLAFGHGHQGMGQAAVTGKIIADLVANRSSQIDISAFAPDRFRARNMSRTARQLIGLSEHQDRSVHASDKEIAS